MKVSQNSQQEEQTVIAPEELSNVDNQSVVDSILS